MLVANRFSYVEDSWSPRSRRVRRPFGQRSTAIVAVGRSLARASARFVIFATVASAMARAAKSAKDRFVLSNRGNSSAAGRAHFTTHR